MTATDELRRLLDERGVKWTRSCYSGMRYLENTKWPIVSSNPIKFTEYSDGQTKLIIDNATPEQAIAATLGGDECEIVSYYEASTRGEVGRERVKLSCGHIVERHSKYCQECGRKIQKAVER